MNTTLYQLSFWVFATLMVGGALGVVFHRSIVYSALCLLTTFLAIAGFFVMLNAPFIAAAQILVYGVGLTIVLIFGIMLTGDKPYQDPVGKERPKSYWLIPAVLCSIFLGFMLWSLLTPNLGLTEITRGIFMSQGNNQIMLPGAQSIIADGGVSTIGQMLFSQYLIPFELASILLLLAMVGAIVLSKRQFPEEEGSDPLVSSLESQLDLHGDDVSMTGGMSAGSDMMDLSEHSPHPQPEKETLGVH